MQKLHDFAQCLDHKEVAVFLTKSESQQKALKLCHKCVVDQQKSLILIDDAKKQFEETKSAVLQQGESINLQNIGILNDLKEQLLTLCKNINVLIDKINQNIDSEIQFIEQSSQQFQKMINDIQFDQIELINQDKSTIIKQQVNYRELQQSFITQIGNLFASICKSKFDQLIQRIEGFEQNEIINQFFDFGLLTNYNQEQTANWICEKHQLQIAFVDLQSQKSIPSRVACLKCVPEYVIQYTDLDQMQELWKSYNEQVLALFNIYISNTQKKQQQVIHQLKESKDVMIQQFDQLIQSIQEKASQGNDELEQHHQLIQKAWYQLSKEELIRIANLLSQQNRIVIFNQTLEKEFQSKESAIEQLISSQMMQFQNLINSSFSQLVSKPVIQDVKNQINKVDAETQIQYQLSITQAVVSLQVNCNEQVALPQTKKSFTYELISQLKENTKCRSIIFNKELSMMIVGQSSGNIKVYDFNSGIAKEIQQFKEHKDQINSLFFMQNSSQFISCSDDKFIIIWSMDNKKQWKVLQKLEGHTDKINCLITNNQEDCIISGSTDKTIKFWIQENQQWKCRQTLSDHTEKVRCLALNLSQNQLISCGTDKLLLIIQQNNNKQWSTIQKIQVERYGFSLCFISNTKFTFQPESLNIMHIYEYDQSSKQFIKSKQDVSIKSGANCSELFPQKYIKDKLVLLNKNGCYVNIIKHKENGEFQTIQEFENMCDCCGLFGSISNDGTYLVTYDSHSSELKIRKYKEI
ncbi:unnamed protein product (macronuclear) [Paramecium tetraurelia]|uniref:Uncharacterized protein n=1 Tax=Paramecium tetraurelia TaxID=5888 RepID=A0BWS6_PARTE|nr:uncharacterized protein GSPATT00032845001 [Paramecium tetraurelia]CAK62993.1 unnamed protein product [Paramecium tetraurelia]|eukprot:XP_001430391.1 hypothetical protein (macronuclear) [Paramecium tetraurelia strain d4-2]